MQISDRDLCSDSSQPVHIQESCNFTAASSSVEIDQASFVHTNSCTDTAAIISMDRLGMAASTLCLIHCLALPFVISMLPVMGWQFMASKGAHILLAAFVFAFAFFAIVPGYAKHRHLNILLSMLAGLSLVLIATFICGSLLPESWEVPLISIGNLTLVATHWRNRKLLACQH